MEEEIVEEIVQEAVNPDEVKARAQGWVPKEEFRGDEEKWIDAKTFVERGQTIVPIMKERNEHLEKEIMDMKQSFKEFAEYHKQTEERAYQKALKEIEQKKLSAVQEADVDTYRQAENEQAELEKNRITPKVSPDEPPELKEFKQANSWYGLEPELTAEADALGGAYIKQNIPYYKVLERVQETIKKLHPEKFSNPKREAPPAVESVVSETGLPKKGNGREYANLPADAKAQCDKWVKSGLLTKEEYIRDYQWE